MRPFVCVALLLLAGPAPAQTKSLHWTAVDVSAHLDRDGRLNVSERQAIRFNGDWNGGERRFHLRTGQTIQLRGISRVDAKGNLLSLREGKLDNIDEWLWHDRTTLRWRSRLASDAPFRDADITYVIDYTLSNVLVARGDEYVLRHDFAFPDRDGVIEQLRVNLTFDDAWTLLTKLPDRLERANVQPGESATVGVRLRYRLSTHPQGVQRGVPPFVGWIVAALLFAIVTWMCLRHFAQEAREGVFAPLIQSGQIDQAWLEENLFRFPPEVVGATWDDETSSAEVAAVLARMVAEGKLSSRIEKTKFWRPDELHLTLLVPRTNLKGYEAALVKAMFVSGDETSTRLIREHYKKKGFDPVSKIRKPVEQLSRKIIPSSGRRNSGRRESWKPIVAMTVVAVILLIATGWTTAQSVIAAAVVSGAVIAIFIFGVIGATAYQKRVTDMKRFALMFVIPIAILLIGVCGFSIVAPSYFPLSLVLLVGLSTLAVAAVTIILATARVPDLGERFHARRRFAAAREHFARQLRSHEPQLRDEWFPYLLALGLGPRIDGWFRAFGNTTASGTSGGSFSGASAPATSGKGWTGGGGAFGGAGATGSWAAAAGAIAGGVSGQSSSGGGGFSSGGSSSGGGGGGGW